MAAAAFVGAPAEGSLVMRLKGAKTVEAFEGLISRLAGAAERRLAAGTLPSPSGQRRSLRGDPELLRVFREARLECENASEPVTATHERWRQLRQHIALWNALSRQPVFRSILSEAGVDAHDCGRITHDALGDGVRESMIAGMQARQELLDRAFGYASPLTAHVEASGPILVGPVDGSDVPWSSEHPNIRRWIDAAIRWTLDHKALVLTVSSLAATLKGHSASWYLCERWLRQRLRFLGPAMQHMHEQVERLVSNESKQFVHCRESELCLSAELAATWSCVVQARTRARAHWLGDEARLWTALTRAPTSSFVQALGATGMNHGEMQGILSALGSRDRRVSLRANLARRRRPGDERRFS